MSGRALLGLGFLVAALAAGAVPASAQGSPVTQPSRTWWFGAGGGYTTFRTDCSNCEHGDDYTGGRGFLLNGGIAVNDKFDGGAEVFSAISGHEDVDYRTTYVLAVGQFRPWKTHGFFLKGGFGIVYFRGTIHVPGQAGSISSQGLGIHYGAGWIFGRDRRVSFGPFGAQYVATMGDIALPAGSAENVVSNSWLAGVVVFFR